MHPSEAGCITFSDLDQRQHATLREIIPADRQQWLVRYEDGQNQGQLVNGENDMASKIEQLKAAVSNGRFERVTMSIHDVAHGLVAMCREGNFLGAVERYYASDVHSVEPSSTPHVPAELVGIELVKAKNHWWIQSHEVHHYCVTGPFIGEGHFGEGHFAVHFSYDVTPRDTRRRTKMAEMALYTVQGDRVTREEFFYAP